MKRTLIIGLGFSLLVLGAVLYFFYPENKTPSITHKLTANTRIDKLVVYKSKRMMLAYANGKVVKSYEISLGGKPIGHKQFEGDKRTPEGLYYIDDKNPNSAYHKNLGISYPNSKDIQYAKRLGKSPGGAIKIHGLGKEFGYLGKLHLKYDWTLGCIAVTNEEIDELYRCVKVGTPIQINP